MKWFKQEELKPAEKKDSKNEKSYSIRFKSRQQKQKETIVLYLSSSLVELAEEKELTYIRFGFDEESGEIGVQLNKKEQGISLINRNGKIRNLFAADEVYEKFKEYDLEVPLDEKLELTKQKNNTFLTKLSSEKEVSTSLNS